MRTMKIIGYAGIFGVALVFSVSSFFVTGTAQARMEPLNSAGKSVHRVSYVLATGTRYTSDSVVYKWGRKDGAGKAKTDWSNSPNPQSGNKWSKPTVDINSSVGSASYTEEARNPWARSSFSEQARNPWARSSFSEQARNPWARS